MKSLTNLDLTCSAVSAGQFGVRVLQASNMSNIECRPANANGVTHPRNTAVQKTARRGFEQGNL